MDGENKPKDQDEGEAIRLSFCCCSMLPLSITLGCARVGTFGRDAGLFLRLACRKYVKGRLVKKEKVREKEVCLRYAG